MGLDLGNGDVKHIYRSADGGRTFAVVVTESADITLVNGPLMAAHPEKSDVLYFVFGTFFQGYGTDLYRYDHGTAAVTLTHNSSDEIGSIAFSTRDAGLMYLGLVTEDIND